METAKEALQRAKGENELQLSEYALQSAKDDFVKTQEVMYAAKAASEVMQVELAAARAKHNIATQRLLICYGIALDEAKGN